MSKIIYQPKGKAGEYAKFAANFYNGCSGCCEYCYNRKGLTSKVLGGDRPTLKKSLGNKFDAMITFDNEIDKYLPDLKKHGLFFNFVSDPCLPETWRLNLGAIHKCLYNNIPVMVLTKQTWWVKGFIEELTSAGTPLNSLAWRAKERIAFGFTLTGHDEMEPGCATNTQRIEAMKILHGSGFKTWASVEPIIDFESSYRMIVETLGFCDLYKIGLRSGWKYDLDEARRFAKMFMITGTSNNAKVYLKDSLIKLTGFNRKVLNETYGSCINADYILFT